MGACCTTPSKRIEDQLASIERTSKARGDEFLDLALFTDGLRAEREQGITIDVAYRYFSTPRRKFILADTPGHVQYTRNMVTGASTANLALILVDARYGVVEQTRRHTYLSTLLGIPHLVLCVNKMDLRNFDGAVFQRIVEEFRTFAGRLDVHDVMAIPIAALHGDNVVDRSVRMPWYDGPPLLDYLEQVEIAADRNLEDGRFPVQYVIRPMRAGVRDYRGYAGSVAGGIFHPGDAVTVLPTGLRTTIKSIDTQAGPVSEAYPPMALVLTLADDVDVSRGDMICLSENLPTMQQDFQAMVCWMDAASGLTRGTRLELKHTTRSVRAVVQDVGYHLNVNTLDREEAASTLQLNEIGLVHLRTAAPLFSDPYRRNHTTGSFILIDEGTNNTVAAGMILPAEG